MEQKIADLIVAAGGEMEFGAFKQAALMAGLRPELWHSAKQRGLVTTRIENGVHIISAVVVGEEGDNA